MLELYTYQLPFKQPFVTGAGTFNYRKGLLVRYRHSQLDLVAEVAPLPGFSKESFGQARNNILSNKTEAEQFFSRPFTTESLNRWIKSQTLVPSVQFGLSFLGLSILSVREETPIHELLHAAPTASLKMNAVIGESDESAFLQAAENYISRGFKVIKCKVTSSPGHLPESIKKVAVRHPSVIFRLDANRSWPRKDLTRLSSQFSGLPIEYIEEPCSVKTADELNDVIERCSLPVAADESLADFGLTNVIETTKKKPYLIIKPMLYGNLMELFATIGSQLHLENRVIVTTALESAVGTRAVALVAATTGSRSSAHGLNTGSLFSKDIAEENFIAKGTFRFNQNSKNWFSFHEIDQRLISLVQ